jgi:hypothetical protein
MFGLIWKRGHPTVMAPETKVPGEQPSRSVELGRTPSPASLLLEQYKILEERRKYFGSQFMQTIGGVGAIISALVGLLVYWEERMKTQYCCGAPFLSEASPLYCYNSVAWVSVGTAPG